MADAEAPAIPAIPRISILVPTYILVGLRLNVHVLEAFDGHLGQRPQNQPVLIQRSDNDWIPGVVTKHLYDARFACLATEVEFYKADGTRARAGFLDHDIRPRE
ncbi:hypothetical protein TRAPUB_11991 [Trametes pubescens]|uniref:Uncharacterized protein n=1 Tax=Trametes pubescens TaxID=154538 RepID=A0A1M2VUZ8_TRAPU|nr:hypothetical protein TRAPUB_11991 [Trametes pubescens]